MTRWEKRAVVITHDVGLHARPAVTLTKLSKSFRSVIEISMHQSGPWIDAKSIVRVMSLKARQNSTLYLRAMGVDAAQAIEALVSLVEQDFDEEDVHASARQA